MNTATITIAGITREVEFPYDNPTCFSSQAIFACKIGNGEKLHRARMDAFKFDSAEDAMKMGYKADAIFTFGTQVVAVTTRTQIRNRQARIVAFADTVAGSANTTKQNYHGSI